MANPWFRMYSEFATDPKVQMMSEAMQRRLTMLFCLKNSNALRNGNDNDSNESSNDEVAFMLRINEAELNETKALFISKGFIDSNWNLLNWDKRQFISDLDPTRAERQKRYREKHSNALRNAPVTPLDTDTDTDTDTDITNSPQQAGDELDIPADEGKQDIPTCPHQEIINLYAKHLPVGIQPKIWTEARQASLRARWREDEKRQNLDWWDRFFAYIAKSDFLTGKVSDRNGRAFEISLDWIVTASSFAKIIEGKYDNKAKL